MSQVEECASPPGESPRLVLWCLSVAYDDDRLEQEIRRQRVGKALVETPRGPHRRAALQVLFCYLFATHPQMQKKKIGELLIEASPEAQEDIVDYMDEFRQEGERTGRAGTLLDLLALRFGKMPTAVKKRVLGANEEALSRWTPRVLTARTLAEVLDGAPEPAAPKARTATRRPRKKQ